MSNLSIPNPKEYQINLKKQPLFDIEAKTNNETVTCNPQSIKVFSINNSHDLTVERQENIEEKSDIKVVVSINA